MPSAERADLAYAQSLRRRSRHIDSLDGFRGLAVLLVVFFHVGQVGMQGHGGLVVLLGHVQQSGWIGVEMFFTLSGFLITGILLRSVHEPHFLRNFYVRRTLRIFPLYYAVLLLLGLLTPMLHLEWHGALPYLLFYLQNFRTATGQLQLELVSPGLHIPLRHFWTLAVEEQFYLVWPFLVLAVRGRRTFLWISGFFVVLCPLLRWYGLVAGIGPAPLRYWTVFHVDSLAWGGLAATVQSFQSERSSHRTGKVLLCLGAVLTFAVLYMEKGSFAETAAPTVELFFSSFGALCGGLLILLTAPGTLPGRLFSVPWLRWFGRYSYGIYIFHLLPFDAYEKFRFFVIAHTGSRALGAAALLLSAFGVSTGLAYVSFQLFERKFLRLKDRIAPSLGSAVLVHAEAGQDVSWSAGKVVANATQE